MQASRLNTDLHLHVDCHDRLVPFRLWWKLKFMAGLPRVLEVGVRYTASLFACFFICDLMEPCSSVTQSLKRTLL